MELKATITAIALDQVVCSGMRYNQLTVDVDGLEYPLLSKLTHEVGDVVSVRFADAFETRLALVP